VVVRAAPDGGHTRRPGYTWGKTGTVVAGHGAMVFPDARAERRREPAQYLYTVAFAARELWGADADPAATVHVDLFESYLEAAR
jgi:nitrile hydratase